MHGKILNKLKVRSKSLQSTLLEKAIFCWGKRMCFTSKDLGFVLLIPISCFSFSLSVFRCFNVIVLLSNESVLCYFALASIHGPLSLYSNLYHTEILKVKYGSSSLNLGGQNSGLRRIVFDSGSSYTYFSKQAYSNLVDSVSPVVSTATLAINHFISEFAVTLVCLWNL